MPLKPRIKVKAPSVPVDVEAVQKQINKRYSRNAIPIGNFTEKDGKIVKKDTAPPHVRAGRRRKANKVTGAKAAK